MENGTIRQYGVKHQSGKDGAWRVQEATLHMLSLMGGFAGAFLGRRLYRHKTQKISFAIVIVLSALLHIALFLYFYFRMAW